MRHISLVQLYEDNREKLLLNWAVNHKVDRRIEIKLSNNYGADVVGHVNIIHPERLQVMGNAEYHWVQRTGQARFRHQLLDILAAKPPAVRPVGVTPLIGRIDESALTVSIARNASSTNHFKDLQSFCDSMIGSLLF